jgi:hypothetical protein
MVLLLITRTGILVSHFLQNILKKLKNMGMVNMMNMGKKKKMRKRSS